MALNKEAAITKLLNPQLALSEPRINFFGKDLYLVEAAVCDLKRLPNIVDIFQKKVVNDLVSHFTYLPNRKGLEEQKTQDNIFCLRLFKETFDDLASVIRSRNEHKNVSDRLRRLVDWNSQYLAKSADTRFITEEEYNFLRPYMDKDICATGLHLDFGHDLRAEVNKLGLSIEKLNTEINLNPKNKSHLFSRFSYGILYRSVLSREVSDQARFQLKFLYLTCRYQMALTLWFEKHYQKNVDVEDITFFLDRINKNKVLLAQIGRYEHEILQIENKSE